MRVATEEKGRQDDRAKRRVRNGKTQRSRANTWNSKARISRDDRVLSRSTRFVLANAFVSGYGMIVAYESRPIDLPTEGCGGREQAGR